MMRAFYLMGSEVAPSSYLRKLMLTKLIQKQMIQKYSKQLQLNQMKKYKNNRLPKMTCPKSLSILQLPIIYRNRYRKKLKVIFLVKSPTRRRRSSSIGWCLTHERKHQLQKKTSYLVSMTMIVNGRDKRNYKIKNKTCKEKRRMRE